MTKCLFCLNFWDCIFLYFIFKCNRVNISVSVQSYAICLLIYILTLVFYVHNRTVNNKDCSKQWRLLYSLQTCTLHPRCESSSLFPAACIGGSAPSVSGNVRQRFSNSLVLSFVLSHACFQFVKYFLETFGLDSEADFESCLLTKKTLYYHKYNLYFLCQLTNRIMFVEQANIG